MLRLLLLLGTASAQWSPNHVVLNEKTRHIEADSTWLDKKQQEVQRVGYSNSFDITLQVSLDAFNKEKVILELLNQKKKFEASAAGNVAAAETWDGKRAQVQKIGDKGGIATVDGHKWEINSISKIVLEHS